jgi:LysM repeat protein
VEKGDTLYNISRRYGLTVDALKRLNNMSVDTISIGQKLRVK